MKGTEFTLPAGQQRGSGQRLLWLGLGMIFILCWYYWHSPQTVRDHQTEASYVPPTSPGRQKPPSLQRNNPIHGDSSIAEATLKTPTIRPRSITKKVSATKSLVSVLETQLPPLDPGMINVTAQGAGVRISGMDGGRMVIPVQIDEEKMPMGFLATDVYVFNYDADRKHWLQLSRDSLDIGNKTVYSTTTKDGDYIAAIIRAPETPESQGYVPTSMNDIKIGDPSSMLQVIAPPKANQQGTASLSYSIESPPGRQGIQPDIRIQYSSDGAAGALGEGWSLSGLSSITLDTRWGVPGYDTQKESETYMLDGQMMACMEGETAITAHRTINTLRSSVTQNDATRFYLRKEGSFQRIVRMGSKPDNYYWVITDKKGTKYHYGGTDNTNLPATLRNPATGNIAEWKLYKVEDVYGNIMDIRYKQTSSLLPESTTEKVYNIVPDSVIYTRFKNSQASNDERKPNFALVFNYVTKLNNRQIYSSGRYGFLNGNVDSLLQISVIYLNENQLIRSYRFFYSVDPLFEKVLLDSVAQYGLSEKFFNGHKFSYHQVSPKSFFSPAVTWKLPDDGLQAATFNLVRNKTTAIAASKSSGKQFGSYFGVGIIGSPASKAYTVGAHFSGNSSTTEGINALADMDGDGMPDKVFVDRTGIYYHRNNGKGFDAAKVSLYGLEAANFSEEYSRTSSSGFEGNFGSFFVGSRTSKTETTINTYFQDVNGDGLVDLVTNNRVFFNCGLQADGTHLFSLFSSQTPVKMNAEVAIATFEAENELKRHNEELASENPLQEVVKVWEAPFAGKITITAPVTFLAVPPADRDKEYKKADGLKVSIQLGNNKIIDSLTIPLREKDSTVFNSVYTENVVAGQRIYFRVQSGVDPLVSNGAYDRVKWQPIIQYSDWDSSKLQPDVYGKNIHYYSAKEDYLLSGSRELTIDTGVAKFDLSGSLRKEPTLDTVWLVINQLKVTERKYNNSRHPYLAYEKDKELFRTALLPGQRTEAPLNKMNISLKLTDSTNSFLEFTIISKSTQDIDHVQWEPKVHYQKTYIKRCLDAQGNVIDCTGSNATQSDPKDIYPVPRYVFADSLYQRGEIWSIPDSMDFTLIPTITFKDTLRFTDTAQHSADLIVTLRDSSGLLAHRQYTIGGGAKEYMLPAIHLPIDSARRVFTIVETRDTALNNFAVNTLEHQRPQYNASVYNGATMLIAGQQDSIRYSGRYRVHLHFGLLNNTRKGSFNVEIVKQTGQVLKTVVIAYDTSSVQYPQTPVLVDFQAGDVISLRYLVNDTAVIARIGAAYFQSYQSLQTYTYLKRVENKFGPMYRGWGQFLYNGMGGRATNLIQEQDLFFALADPEGKRRQIDNIGNSLQAKDSTTNVEIAGLDEFTPIKAPFYMMLPFADGQSRRWQGSDVEIYLDSGTMSASRIGLKDVVLIDPFARIAVASGKGTDNSYAYGIKKMIHAKNTSKTIGASSFSFNDSRSAPFTEVMADFIDINGDRFPDIVAKAQAQITNPLGTLRTDPWMAPGIHYSKNKSTGIVAGGGYFQSVSSITMQSGTNRGAKQSTQGSAESGRTLLNAAISIGIPTQGSIGSEQTLETWMDVNNDGLADRVKFNEKANFDGTVRLNLGQRGKEIVFTEPIPYRCGDITKGRNMSIPPGLSLGISLSHRSFTAGTGMSITNSATEFALQDFNNDGLPDRAHFGEAGQVDVEFNTGFGFKPIQEGVIDVSIPINQLNSDEIATLPIKYLPRIPDIDFAGIHIKNPINTWINLDRTKLNGSIGQSIGGSATFGFNIWIPFTPFIRFVFTPEADFNIAMSKTYRQFSDIDGDGYADYLYSTKETELEVSLSNLGKVNKLKSVSNPLGGSFEIEYKHSGATRQHPSGKWVMASVATDDGDETDRTVTDKGFDTKMEFNYLAGKYDRYEREFLGFGRVETTDLDFDGKFYRTRVTEYDTANYYTAGNLLKEYVTGKDGKKFTETVNDYYLNILKPAGDNYTNKASATQDLIRQLRFTGICFSPLKTTRQYNYEKQTTPIVLNQSLYTYNATGGVTNFKYREGKPVSDKLFDYECTVTMQAPDLGRYILDLPTRVVVAKDATVFRQVDATYHPLGKLRTVSKKMTDQLTETTTLEYDGFGNFKWVRKPTDITNYYEYEKQTETYVQKVKPDPGFASETYYDIRFGILITSKDKNDKYMRYLLDEFGRIDTIVGPKECNELDFINCDKKYTIKISYQLGPKPYSIVNHFDGLDRNGMETISFSDGFGRITGIKKTAAVTQADGGPDPAQWIVSGRNIYDAFGRVAKTYYPATDPLADGTKDFPIVNTSVAPTIMKYDELDRATEKIMPDVETVFTTSYGITEDLSFSSTTALNKINGGNQTRAVFTNGSGLTDKETAQFGTNGTITTQYKYDPIHQLQQVIDHLGKSTTYTYDKAGNKQSIDHPDAGKTTFVYDKAARLTGKITANGALIGDVIKYEYDRYNHLIAVEFPRHKENNVRYYYGSYAACENCRDRLVFQEDASGSQLFSYDNLGAIRETRRTLIVPFSKQLYTFVTGYYYDSWNRLTSIQYPDGELVKYSYNKAGLLQNITGQKMENDQITKTTIYVSKIGYDQFEKRILLTYGNDITTRYSYQPQRRRLETMQVSGMRTGVSEDISLFSNYQSTYSYDNQDNIISNITTRGAQNKMEHTYEYDKLNRLVAANGIWTRTGQDIRYDLDMGYDELYNVKSKNLSLASVIGPKKQSIRYEELMDYTGKGHQLTQMQQTITRNNQADKAEKNKEIYTYDANGNNTLNQIGDKAQPQVSERKIVWDEENRICAISMSGFVSNYVYDAAGQRTIKLSTQGGGVVVNGKMAGYSQQIPVSFSLYANPYFSMRNGPGLYTKHIYIGTERIVSQLESEGSFTRMENQESPTKPMKRALCPDGSMVGRDTIGYYKRREAINQRINADFDSLRLPYLKIVSDALTILPKAAPTPIHHPIPGKITPERLPALAEATTFNYFYHSNHLGTTAFITDDNKYVVHYVEYLPFGETFVEHRTNYASQFLFNGKEFDQENGLYYFGSRYYDPHTYQWLGVDPKWESYHGFSPYNYALNNPIILNDPDGSSPGNPAKAPDWIIGTSMYYKWREDEYYQYSCWNPWDRPKINYYSDYGYKYAERFSNELRPKLSDAGKAWLDRAKINLQLMMEEELKKNPNLEFSSEEFQKMAYQTHVDAYMNAGLGDLGWFDLFKIGFTPDFKDTFGSWEGIKQLGSTLGRILGHKYGPDSGEKPDQGSIQPSPHSTPSPLPSPSPTSPKSSKGKSAPQQLPSDFQQRIMLP